MVRGVDTVQTRDGNVAIQDSNSRLSVRSQRRGGKGKNVANPTVMYNNLKANGKKVGEGVHEMFQSFERESPTFLNFFKKENESKNRYPTEIFLYDKNRVILNDDRNSTSGDYYHGSYVDGWEQPKHYVLAQAPFTSETEIDFYRLVTQLKPDMIIFLMKFEGDDAKFLPPYSKDETKSVGPFTIKVTDEPIKDKNFECILLSISGNKNDISKQPICILNSWTDDNKVPTDDLTKFYSFLRIHSLSSKPREGQYLILCPTGAHRSGAWMLYDSEAERLKTKGRIRFTDSVKALRFQRSNTIDTQEIFDQIINALITCAKSV